MKVLDLIKNLVIVGFATIALVAVAANFNLPVKGFRLLVVQSGSMEPAIGVGSIVLTKPTSDYLSPISASKFNQGDVITFSSGNSLVSHRVVDSSYEKGEFFYQTKGDANQQLDNTLVSEKNTIGKVVFTVPTLGKFVQFLKTPLGYFLMILIPSLYVIITELFVLWRELRKTSKNFSLPVPKRAFTPITVLVFGAFYLVGGTASYFTNTSTSLNNVLQAASAFPGAPGSVVINEIMWMGSQGNAADEWIELRNITNSSIDISGWKIVNLASGPGGTITIPSGKSIPANGFFLVSNDTEPNSVISVIPDVVTSSVSLLDPGEQLILKTSADVVIDTANGTGSWFAGQNGGGPGVPEKSMERNLIPADGTISSNWHTATIQLNIDSGEREIATPKAANSL